MSSDSDSASHGTDSDSSSKSAASSNSSRSSTKRAYSQKKYPELHLKHMHYYFDKFGLCEKCQDIYWEMRHTWNDDDGGSLYTYGWYNDERFSAYENENVVSIGHKAVMKQYRKAILECQECPRNKDTPCSLRDLAYSRISVLIGIISFEHKKRTTKYFHKYRIDHEEYNRRVSKLPILDWMIKDLEAKPCKWECSHMRQICSTLVSFD